MLLCFPQGLALVLMEIQHTLLVSSLQCICLCKVYLAGVSVGVPVGSQHWVRFSKQQVRAKESQQCKLLDNNLHKKTHLQQPLFNCVDNIMGLELLAYQSAEHFWQVDHHQLHDVFELPQALSAPQGIS